MPRVLIVDDSADFRNTVGARLKQTGHEVSFAGDGSEALGLLQKQPVDLILLDYHMPMWDGVESMVLFRHNQIKSPVIAYTCKDRHSTSPFESVMMTLGTVARVRVSEDPEELVKKAEEVLMPERNRNGGVGEDVVPLGYPAEIDWERVRMLNFDGLTVTLVFEGEQTQQFSFETRDQMDRVINAWFKR